MIVQEIIFTETEELCEYEQTAGGRVLQSTQNTETCSFISYANRLNMYRTQNLTINDTNLREREGCKSSGIMNETSLLENLIVFSKV